MPGFARRAAPRAGRRVGVGRWWEACVRAGADRPWRRRRGPARWRRGGGVRRARSAGSASSTPVMSSSRPPAVRGRYGRSGAPEQRRAADVERGAAGAAVGPCGYLSTSSRAAASGCSLADHLEGERQGVRHDAGQFAHPDGHGRHGTAAVGLRHLGRALDDGGGDGQFVHGRVLGSGGRGRSGGSRCRRPRGGCRFSGGGGSASGVRPSARSSPPASSRDLSDQHGEQQPAATAASAMSTRLAAITILLLAALPPRCSARSSRCSA